jgi:hypothetical protein
LPFEFLWAFYSDWYGLLRQEWETKQSSSQGHSLLDELLGISLEDAPLQLVLLVVGSKGQTFIIKNIIFYNDTAYVFRLLNLMDETNISFNGLYNSLYNSIDKDKGNDFRNQFFYRVLNKKSVVLQAERFAFHISMLSKDQPVYLKEIVDFVRFYETGMGVAQMNKEQVEVAVNLGKSIVLQAKENLNPDEFKKIKGDLFTLRKCRTKGTFLSQINTLQLRYGLSVSGRIAEGILENVPFEEFKAYCMLGALNTFNSLSKAKKDEGGQQA